MISKNLAKPRGREWMEPVVAGYALQQNEAGGALGQRFVQQLLAV